MRKGISYQLSLHQNSSVVVFGPLPKQFRNDSGAVTELFNRYTGLLYEREPVIGERRVLFWQDNVLTVLDVFRATAARMAGTFFSS